MMNFNDGEIGFRFLINNVVYQKISRTECQIIKISNKSIYKGKITTAFYNSKLNLKKCN